MQLLKPVWVSHDDKPIFSIDIHPNGERFATGGQGADSGRVVVWNMAPVISETAENDPTIPKLLCQMDNHLGCVNVVRWSPNGNLLASGGDDKLVMVWKLSGEGGTSMVFGGGGKINVEQWRCVTTLRAHSGDVLDLAWAPHGDWLATCSVDNTVIIWNTEKFPEIVTTLKGHSGLVKGVAWDPVGKYLASQSDDKSLRVWRTGQWTEEVVVTHPFEECSGTTHVLRLSWSPDGQYLVSAHAMNGGGPTAHIIEREGWKQDKDFVGHRKAITCVKFNSNILQRSYPSMSKTRYCVCAVGSRDRSLSVWLTSLRRPLFVMQELFKSSVLDLSWSTSGLVLMACSWDGTVVCIQFDTDELGKRLPAVEKEALYERLYGNTWNASTCAGQTIIEDPELLLMKEKLEKKVPPVVNKNNIDVKKQVNGTIGPATPQIPASTPDKLTPVTKQIETRLPDGKRRITPMFLMAPPTPSKDILKEKTNTTPEPPQVAVNTFCSSSPEKSKIIIETVTDKPVEIIEKDWKERALGPRLYQNSTSGAKLNKQCLPLTAKGQGTTSTVRYTGTDITLCATNKQIKTAYGPLSRLQMFKNNKLDVCVWETYFGASILSVSNTKSLIVITCDDSNVYTLETETGTRILPSFVLSSPAVNSVLSANGRCCVLTQSNRVYIWDLWPPDKAHSVASDLAVPSNIVVSSCILNHNNDVSISSVDGRTYVYSIPLQTWMCLANPRDPLSRNIVGGAIPPSTSTGFPLAVAQRACGSAVRSLGPPSTVLAYLDGQVAAALAIESAVEYKHWLLATVTHLLENGPESRLRSLLDDLLGPLRMSDSWKSEILGMKKHDLLLDVLNLFVSHVRWQRLYMEYFEQLPK